MKWGDFCQEILSLRGTWGNKKWPLLSKLYIYIYIYYVHIFSVQDVSSRALISPYNSFSVQDNIKNIENENEDESIIKHVNLRCS